MKASVTVVGHLGWDLVLEVPDLPGASVPSRARDRHELVGGKGANQAVALTQLGLRVQLLAVVGDDDRGAAACRQLAADGVDVTDVVFRQGAATALFVDVTDGHGARHVVEHVPDACLLRPEDLVVRPCTALLLQLEQPPDTLRLAADRYPSALVVLDGATDDHDLVRRADILRADAAEAERLAGRQVDGLDDALSLAHDLLSAGPRLVALGLGGGDAGGDVGGDVVVWSEGHVHLPHVGPARDPTGGGDSFVAALTAALVSGKSPAQAAVVAGRAAASTVSRVGGRPALDPSLLDAS